MTRRGEIGVAGLRRPLPAAAAELTLGNSGTTIRFLTAWRRWGTGRYRLDGTPRMRERPIQDLLDALGQLGADARSERNGCPPVVVRAAGSAVATPTVAGDMSSQFLSGLLMAAPYAPEPVELAVGRRLVSKPYVTMTLRVMEAFGVVDRRRDRRPAARPYCGRPRRYRAAHYAIEPDASAASYFFAAAAITGGSVTVEGLARRSIQGDVAFCDCLPQMGCLVGRGRDRMTVTGRRSRASRST